MKTKSTGRSRSTRTMACPNERASRKTGQPESARTSSPTDKTPIPARPARKLRLPAYVRHG